jgi:hypothetical protein
LTTPLQTLIYNLESPDLYTALFFGALIKVIICLLLLASKMNKESSRIGKLLRFVQEIDRLIEKHREQNDTQFA